MFAESLLVLDTSLLDTDQASFYKLYPLLLLLLRLEIIHLKSLIHYFDTKMFTDQYQIILRRGF